MALLFFDGFDHYSNLSKPTGKWDAGSGGSFQAGRFGGQAMNLGGPLSFGQPPFGGMTKSFGLTATQPFMVGAAINLTAYTGYFVTNFHGFMNLLSSADDKGVNGSIGNYVFSIAADQETHKLKVLAGADEYNQTAIAWSDYEIPTALWQYIEVKISNSGGEVYVEGNRVCTFPGTAAGITRVRFTGTSMFFANLLCDDVYIADGSGSLNNDVLGPSRVTVVYPNADGSKLDFIPAVPTTHFPNVNLPVNNFSENGKYVYKGTKDAIDLFKVDTSVTNISDINGIQINVAHRKDNDGDRAISPMTKTTVVGNTVGSRAWPAYLEYTNAHALMETNPDTNNLWSLSEIANAEFGLKIVV